MPDREHERRYEDVLEQSKRLREEVAALRKRNDEVVEQRRQTQEKYQRFPDAADAGEKQRELDREIDGVHDPEG